MDLQEKKMHILNLCGCGISYSKAKIDARLTFQESQALDKDVNFQNEVRYTRNHEEIRLTQLYRATAAVEAAAKQSTAGIRAYLKDMYPDSGPDPRDQGGLVIPPLEGRDPEQVIDVQHEVLQIEEEQFAPS